MRLLDRHRDNQHAEGIYTRGQWPCSQIMGGLLSFKSFHSRIAAYEQVSRAPTSRASVKYWMLDKALFMGNFGGFTSLFVTASVTYGETESIGITPLQLSQSLHQDDCDVSFTLVFAEAGSKAGASFMNVVILTSVISGKNHALFAGTRVVYSLAAIGQAPRIFLHTNRNGVPWVAVLAVASVSLIFLVPRSFLAERDRSGLGLKTSWVSNQIAWWCIGVSSWRFRRAWVAQGRKIEELKFPNPLGGFAAPAVVFSMSAIILIQGWSAWQGFDEISFVSNYIELPLFALLYVLWRLVKPTPTPSLLNVDANSGRHVEGPEDATNNEDIDRREHGKYGWLWKIHGLVA
ncbi:amino acid permease-domain-containing protein [Mycena galopus ATCC 62051]|nr:amino acid permease-domain-containing protein [Mycena galopus ATCC 62051]